MTAAPAGAEVALYYDSPWRDVQPGDVVQTRTGRRYLVRRVRRQARGRHLGRQHLRCEVLPADHELDADTVVHPVFWYRRQKAAR